MDKGLPTIQQFCLPLYFLTYLFTNVHKEILKNMLIVVTFTTENLGDNTHTHTYTHTHTHTYIYFIIKSEKAMLPFHFSLSCIGEENGNPLQCSCLENPRDGGAWWAVVHGVTQSRTGLK